ncbi:MAG TPA: alpha/beta hydrolase [Kofleriaceae bacterium]|nr:alpha/beta hydrolase [Kofleriaceae bacterium]
MRSKTSPQIAFDDVGDREPALLALPGWCAQRTAFRPMYSHLERRVLAVDWRGHGGSEAVTGEFGVAELVEDALAVMSAAGAERVIPLATAHAGWVAIELRRRLGADRVPGVVLVDWMVLGAPPPFMSGLAALQNVEQWQAMRDRLFAMWTEGVSSPEVQAFVRTMGHFGFDMWSRAGREIANAFAAQPVPLEALAPLECPTLHVYAQPADPAFLAAQEDFARKHPWFRVQRVSAHSHFPTIEAAAEVAAAVESFARDLA